MAMVRAPSKSTDNLAGVIDAPLAPKRPNRAVDDEGAVGVTKPPNKASPEVLIVPDTWPYAGCRLETYFRARHVNGAKVPASYRNPCPPSLTSWKRPTIRPASLIRVKVD
jgi:hypothetical protein